MVYDYLIVGTGLFGSVFAYEAAKRGHSVKMLEKRAHIGGNCYTEKQVGIDIHKYGAHIFHTSSKKFGTTSISLLIFIPIFMNLLQTIKVSYIISPSI